MIRRKAEKEIKKWIVDSQRALLVTGARQVGKTYLIRACLDELNCDYVELNLLQDESLVAALRQSVTIDDLKINLSALLNVTFSDGKTILFIDEIQEFREILTKIKFWVDDGRIKFIMSGSLLGVELKDIKSAPVGYMDEVEMFPLDFEEFLKASRVTDETISYLKKCYQERIQVSDTVNNKMMIHLKRYLVVGGMPAAVDAYITTGNINDVTEIQENIIRQYRRDFTKYESEEKKMMLTAIYDQVPAQLLKQNRRFNYSDIEKKLRFEKLENSFLWLKYAGVVIAVTNVTQPRLALKQNEKSSLLKLYASDVGLLTCQYGSALRGKILMNDEKLNIGGIYENFVAQELHAHGYETYFYNRHGIGELDFVITHDMAPVPIEVKSGKDYYVHSAIDKAVHNVEYEIKEGYVFANANIEVKDKLVYYPIYLCGFISDKFDLPTLSLDI